MGLCNGKLEGVETCMIEIVIQEFEREAMEVKQEIDAARIDEDIYQINFVVVMVQNEKILGRNGRQRLHSAIRSF